MNKSNPENSPPSFYKIYLDESANNLRLPSAFVKNLHLEGKFPQNPVLKILTGQKWRVEIENNGDNACFGKGWLDFVKDTKTQVGDFLVFTLIANFSFQVYIFDPDGCLKDLSSATHTNCKNSCSCSGFRITDADLKDAITIEEEDDDGDTNVEEHDDDDHEVVADRKDIEFQPFEGKEKSIKPCFQKVLTAFNAYSVELPQQFIHENEIRNARKTILRNKAGREWPVTIKKNNRGRVFISHGWANFRKVNKLMERDTCSFLYFHGDHEGSQSGFIQVEVVKKAARESGRPPRIQAARKRGRPPRIRTGKRSRITDADVKNAIKYEEEEDDGDTNVEELDDDDDHEDDDENDIELQPFERKEKSMNHRFQKVLTSSNAYYLELPRGFVFESGLRNDTKTDLRNKEGRYWPITVKGCDNRVYIARGWANFRTENKLMDGDTCSFQYFHGDQASQGGFIQVEVVKKAARRRGRPPRILSSYSFSCSRSRITDTDLKDAITIEEEDDADHDDDDDHEVDYNNDIGFQPFEGKEKSVKPCFEKVLTTFNSYSVELPQQFMRESELTNARKTILRNKAEREWPVTIKKNNLGRVFISHGWANFRTVNKLTEGDTCSFQYFHDDHEGSQSGFIQVEVVKKAARESGRPPRIQAARKRGRPPRIRPGKR